MRILSLDYSFSKSGFGVTDIDDDGVCNLINAGLVSTDKELDPMERIGYQLKEIEKLYKKYNPDLVVKEQCIVGRSATAENVLKAHGVLEYDYYLKVRPLEDLHNRTIKAWAKRYMGVKPKEPYDNKLIVAQAIEKYYGKKIDCIWGSRGGLKDDIADAIAIAIVYQEKVLTE